MIWLKIQFKAGTKEPWTHEFEENDNRSRERILRYNLDNCEAHQLFCKARHAFLKVMEEGL